MVLGVEIAANGDLGMRIGIEQLVDGEPQLQGLTCALDRRQEKPLRPASNAFPDERRFLLSRNHRRERCAKMHVEYKQPVATAGLDLRHQDRAVEPHGLPAIVGRHSCQTLVGYGPHRLMPNLAMRHDRIVRQDDEIVHVGNAAALGASCRDALIGLVWSSLQQIVERMQGPQLLARSALSIDFLQTDHVGTQPLELRPQNLCPLPERNAGA